MENLSFIRKVELETAMKTEIIFIVAFTVVFAIFIIIILIIVIVLILNIVIIIIIIIIIVIIIFIFVITIVSTPPLISSFSCQKAVYFWFLMIYMPAFIFLFFTRLLSPAFLLNFPYIFFFLSIKILSSTFRLYFTLIIYFYSFGNRTQYGRRTCTDCCCLLFWFVSQFGHICHALYRSDLGSLFQDSIVSR